MLRRRKGRRLRLLRLLQENNLAPKDKGELQRLMQKDPYKLRARAVKEKLEPYAIGRILLHIAKRRGFKSNRKQAEDMKDRKKKNEIDKFEQSKIRLKAELKGRTLGEFWYEETEKQPFEPIRNRAGDYKWVAERDQYVDEVKRIWAVQELSKELLEKILQNEGKDDEDKLIFWQQDYRLSERKKRKVVGKCSLMTGKLRCPYSNRKAQEFRMLQKVNDLLVSEGGKERKLTPEERELLITELSLESWMGFEDIRKKVKLGGHFNLEWRGSDRLPGNAVDYELRKLFSKEQIKKLPADQKEKVWVDILRYLEDEKMVEKDFAKNLKDHYELELTDLDKLNKIQIPSGHVAFCEEILDRLLLVMRRGMSFYDAREQVCRELKLGTGWDAVEELPVPDRAHGVEITNPAVSNALHQVRKVINALIKELGKPDKIVIELAREIKASKEHREEIIDEQTQNRREIENARKLISEQLKCSIEEVADWQVERYRLWRQQKCRSPYSGECIGFSQLFGSEMEVDHILPLSISLDNSLSNKVVCFTKENRDKAQLTPIDWLESDAERWERVQQAIAHWNPKSKKMLVGLEECPEFDSKAKVRYNREKLERFFVRTDEIREKYQPGNLLSDTTYITTAVREYLQRLYPARVADEKVATTKGGITAELRKLWGLNAILGAKKNKKNRSDLRHHAIDAAVAAVTEEKIIMRVTKTLQDAWPEKRYGRIKAPNPWPTFVEDLDAAIKQAKVSQKVDHEVAGGLLEEQPFGVTEEVKEEFNKGRMQQISKHAWLCAKKMKYLRRRSIANAIKKVKDLDKIPLEAVRLKSAILGRLSECGIDVGNKKAKIPEDAMRGLVLEDKRGRKIPVKKIQIAEKNGNMIIITNEDGAPYQAYPSSENHHIEIFRYKVKGRCKYICKLWTMMEVAQRAARKEPIILRKHPEFEDAEFVMSLSKSDAVILKDKNGNDVFARVAIISQGKLGKCTSIDMMLSPLELADMKFLEIPGSKDETKKLQNEFKREWRITSLNDFSKGGIRKVTIDPLGRVRWAEKKYWGHD
jgi:CRISPR-associated endonuclease Csn1